MTTTKAYRRLEFDKIQPLTRIAINAPKKRVRTKARSKARAVAQQPAA